MQHALGYFYDDRLRKAVNRRGQNYWFRYIEEILDHLGVRGDAIPPSSSISGRRVLILGDCNASALPLSTRSSLKAWVEAGGILVGFMTTGLDDLFGVRAAGGNVAAKPFTVGGWMSLAGRGEAAGLLDPQLPRTACPILSPFRRVKVTDAVALTNLWKGDGTDRDPGCPVSRRSPALTRRTLGKGRAFYFAFNLPQAIWTYQQGRPIEKDLDHDGLLRTGDAIIVGARPPADVPCADLIMRILENILARSGIPFIDQLPPLRGGPADALFHIGGDDEASPDLPVKMSHLMKSFGMPYHINCMLNGADRFEFTDSDRAVYERNGHEFSLHFDFISRPKGVKHPSPIPEAEYDRQFRLFVKRYGKTPVCANTHCLRASGWADTARFGEKRGILGENTILHHTIPPMDPVNLFGTPFGTVYPHFVYEEARFGNRRIKFVTLPIGFYEPGSYGYEKTHPFFGKNPYQPREYRRVVDLACRYGWTLNLFMHPGHMFHPRGRAGKALKCMLDRMRQKKARLVCFGTDALCLWWHARSRTRVSPGKDPSTFVVKTDNDQGVVVRFSGSVFPPHATLSIDGRKATATVIDRLGRQWVCVAVPKGRHTLQVIS